MALDINGIVNVQVVMSPKAAANRGFGQLLIIGSSNVIPKTERIRYYKSLGDVGNDFGTGDPEYKAAQTYFAQSPTPNDLAIGYWDSTQKGTQTVINGAKIKDVKKAGVNGALKLTAEGRTYDLQIDLSECKSLDQIAAKLSESFVKEGTGTPLIPEVPATSAYFTSGNIDGSVIEAIKRVKDGSIKFNIDGSKTNFTDLDFSKVLTVDDVANVIKAKVNTELAAGYLKGATVEAAATLQACKLHNDWSMKLTVDSNRELDITGLDLQAANSMDDVATKLTAKLNSEAVATWVDDHIVITSKTTGTSSKVTVAKDGTGGTQTLATTLKLRTEDQAKSIAGTDKVDRAVITVNDDNIVFKSIKTGTASQIGQCEAGTGGTTNICDTLKLTTKHGAVVNLATGVNTIPEVPAVPAEYFATCNVMEDNLVILPTKMSIALTLPVKSTDHAEDPDLSFLCGFSTEAGGKLVKETVRNESIEDVINLLADKSQTWYASYFSNILQDDEIIKAAKLVEALSPFRLIGFTLQAENEKTAEYSLGSRLKDLGLKRTMCQYDPTNQFAVVSYIGRLVTTNFLANNSVITLKFKQEPTVSPLDLSTSEAKYLRDKNINVFAKYSNDTAIIQEGTQSSGAWSDEVIGLDWLQNYVQNAVYNTLYTSAYKIPQTNSGMQLLANAVKNALRQAFINGLLAERPWTGPEIGNITPGNFLNNGFAVYTQNVESQSQADREARKAPVIQVACTLSGAFHFADVLINVVR